MESTSKVSFNNLRDYLTLFGIGGAIIILDQTTKFLVRSNLALSEWWSPWEWLEPYARIVNWKNTGAAFGILPSLGDFIAILAVVVAIAIVYYFPRVPREDWTLRLAMGLEFGGALGNLFDRLTIGWVTDFVSIWRFPVFNVADFCITMGVIVLLLGVWSQERKKELPSDALETVLSPENSSDQIGGENLGE
ncbi:MAG TPA: signal peptidase II [Anaerolineales bacterium]|nr:signal peptidase II [Anaerolineales bacterium]